MAQQQTDLSSLREGAVAFFRSYGLTLSTGINALLKQVKEQEAPLEIDASFHTYSAELAEQWAKEDPLFCEETYKNDPYFTKSMQAELRRREGEPSRAFDPTIEQKAHV
jgi:antitoxin component of RelBE/YafQ-DinJ toxin-antitoxin module